MASSAELPGTVSPSGGEGIGPSGTGALARHDPVFDVDLPADAVGRASLPAEAGEQREQGVLGLRGMAAACFKTHFDLKRQAHDELQRGPVADLLPIAGMLELLLQSFTTDPALSAKKELLHDAHASFHTTIETMLAALERFGIQSKPRKMGPSAVVSPVAAASSAAGTEAGPAASSAVHAGEAGNGWFSPHPVISEFALDVATGTEAGATGPRREGKIEQDVLRMRVKAEYYFKAAGEVRAEMSAAQQQSSTREREQAIETIEVADSFEDVLRMFDDNPTLSSQKVLLKDVLADFEAIFSELKRTCAKHNIHQVPVMGKAYDEVAFNSKRILQPWQVVQGAGSGTAIIAPPPATPVAAPPPPAPVEPLPLPPAAAVLPPSPAPPAPVEPPAEPPVVAKSKKRKGFLSHMAGMAGDVAGVVKDAMTPGKKGRGKAKAADPVPAPAAPASPIVASPPLPPAPVAPASVPAGRDAGPATPVEAKKARIVRKVLRSLWVREDGTRVHVLRRGQVLY